MPDRLSAATRRTTARATAAVALAVGLVAVTTGCTAPDAAIVAESAGPSATSRPSDAATAVSDEGEVGARDVSGRRPVPVRQATPRPVQAPIPPTRLNYPALGVDMAVESVGMADGGEMQIPDDADVAGWYRFGSVPDRGVGSTLLAAHVNTVHQDRGALYHLDEARIGDELQVVDAAGTAHPYRVARVEHLQKATLDWLPYVTRQGPEQLVLVTCGGEWIEELGAYDENVVVVALPAD